MKLAYVYKCTACEDTYTMREKNDNHRCDWVDCESTEPLEFVEVVEA